MANLTKEQRIIKEAEDRVKLKAELEAEISANISDIVSENNELKIQITKMMEMINGLQSKDESVQKVNMTSDSGADFNDTPDVEMNKRISVTSMTNGGVNLKTANDGAARHFRLERLGQTIPIVYEHLINCINTDRWLFEDGLVYINDSKVVEEQYLEEFYAKFLDPEKIAHILDFDNATIKNMVVNTTVAIQETIATLVAEKINSKQTVDMNKVEIVGKSCDPQIDIRALADKLK